MNAQPHVRTDSTPQGVKSFFLRNSDGIAREALAQMANVTRFAAMAGGSIEGAPYEELAGLEAVLLCLEDGLRELSESPIRLDVDIPPTDPEEITVAFSRDEAARLMEFAQGKGVSIEEAAGLCVAEQLGGLLSTIASGPSAREGQQ